MYYGTILARNLGTQHPPQANDQPKQTTMTSPNPDDDYKAFIIPLHPQHGVLLLYCTRKKGKGSHHQLPGGHVDKEDFDDAGEWKGAFIF